MPSDSLGRAYLVHIERHGLNPTKLLELSREAGGESASPDADIRWMTQRNALSHDLWHVLTGFGADAAGEAALLVFACAQMGGRANALLALGANLSIMRILGFQWITIAWRSWLCGRRSVCLAAVPFERLLPMPLSVVRAAAGIAPQTYTGLEEAR
jgi:ubiquinone biosynthesis protein COQ4